MRFNRKPIEFEIDDNGCFICTSHARNKGYPLSWFNGKKVRLLRFVYEQMYGEIPEGHVIRHKCDVRPCINPEHLETGTPKQNIYDAIERGRMQAILGEANRNSKLTESQVKEIKQSLKYKTSSNYKLAAKYGVSEMAIRKIKKGTMWAHVNIDHQDIDECTISEKENRMKEYAVYKGDDLLCMGTVQECAENLGVKTETIRYYLTPAYQRRLAKRKARNYRTVICLED